MLVPEQHTDERKKNPQKLPWCETCWHKPNLKQSTANAHQHTKYGQNIFGLGFQSAANNSWRLYVIEFFVVLFLDSFAYLLHVYITHAHAHTQTETPYFCFTDFGFSVAQKCHRYHYMAHWFLTNIVSRFGTRSKAWRRDVSPITRADGGAFRHRKLPLLAARALSSL